MTRRWLAAAAFGLVLTAGGCGGGGGGEASTVERLCSKGLECNVLAGVSRQECVEGLNQCVSSLTPSLRADWERLVKQCLTMQTCSMVESCYDGVGGC